MHVEWTPLRLLVIGIEIEDMGEAWRRVMKSDTEIVNIYCIGFRVTFYHPVKETPHAG